MNWPWLRDFSMFESMRYLDLQPVIEFCSLKSLSERIVGFKKTTFVGRKRCGCKVTKKFGVTRKSRKDFIWIEVFNVNTFYKTPDKAPRFHLKIVNFIVKKLFHNANNCQIVKALLISLWYSYYFSNSENGKSEKYNKFGKLEKREI